MHQYIAVGIICYIAGLFTMLVVLAFMMGACPDSEKKRQEDWEGMQETTVQKMEQWYCKGYKKGFAEAVRQYEPAIKLYETKVKLNETRRTSHVE
jgi:hypothetical protein